MRLDTATLGAVVAAVLATSVPSALAGGPYATYGGELKETRHEVTVARRGRVATFAVVREIANPGDRHDEAELEIELPQGAVATSLRLYAGGRWHEGALLEAEAATAAYEALTRQGPRSERGPVLLSWSMQGTLSLRVYPVPAGGAVRVEYTLTAPVCYAAGHYLVGYPERTAPGRVHAPGARVLSADRAAEVLGVDPVEACEGNGEGGGDPAEYVVYPGERRHGVAAGLASYGVDGTHALVRVDVEPAAELEPAPRSASIVFVVDASHSQGEAGIAAQLELVAGYLTHLPDASFDVVIYRRRAERLFGRMLPARGAPAALARVRPEQLRPGNGSHLERGVALAADALRGRSGPTRIVLFTDDRLRQEFEVPLAASAFERAPSQTLVHVVSTSGGAGAYAYERHFEHRFADFAHGTGGIAVELAGGPGHAPAAAAAVMLDLVRPTRIDAFTLEGLPAEHDLNVPEALVEGVGLRDLLILDERPEALVMTGWLWGRPWRQAVPVDAGLAARLPALVFGTNAWEDLPSEHLPALARAGRAVSPVTSYLARDPKAPSTSWDYEDLGGIGIGGVGRVSSCGCGGIGRGAGFGTVREIIDHVAALRQLLRARVDACFLLHDELVTDVRLDIETTGSEIVDVSVSGTSESLGECLAEAAWELELDERFTREAAVYPLHFNRSRPAFSP